MEVPTEGRHWRAQESKLSSWRHHCDVLFLLYASALWDLQSAAIGANAEHKTNSKSHSGRNTTKESSKSPAKDTRTKLLARAHLLAAGSLTLPSWSQEANQALMVTIDPTREPHKNSEQMLHCGRLDQTRLDC